jgi:hypothetical protein
MGMHHARRSAARAALSSLIGNLCEQLGVRCMQRLDLGLNLPLEIAAPFGELGLEEDFEAAFPVEQVTRDGLQASLPLVCFCRLSQWQGCSSLPDLCRLLLGVHWWRSGRWRRVLLSLA